MVGVEDLFLKEAEMGWLDKILGKLVDMNLNLQSEQTGILNIKTAKNTYNMNLTFTTPEASKAFAEVIAAGNQTKVIEDAEKLLSANSSALEVLPDSTAVQVANATIVASAAAASGVEGKVRMEIAEPIGISENVVVKLFPESV